METDQGTQKKMIFIAMKQSCILALLLFLLTAASAENAVQLRGCWKCQALDPYHLALSGDYSELQRRLFLQCHGARIKENQKIRKFLPVWAKEFQFQISGTEAINLYRPRLVKLLRDSPRIGLASDKKTVTAVNTGFWMNPVGQSRFPDWTGLERFTPNADTAYWLFLRLDRPLENGEKLKITLPTGEQLDYTYRVETPTPLFKINQVGYLPEARKYAYLGAWLGTAGPMRLHQRLDGKKFQLVNAENGNVELTGIMRKRPDDPVTVNGTPFTGEEVLDLDFSAAVRPGKYYLTAETVGRSEVFRIGNGTMAEAFFIHMRGLYHQRCGIAKEKPYTNWVRPVCHTQCYQGTFPPDNSHYSKGSEKRAFGFFLSNGKSLQVKHFDLIAQNAPEPKKILPGKGGWHDAADWDRRPQHLAIVGDLAAVYMLKPGNFTDGQLYLPESGNGIPDILDEALWGLEHLRQNQQPDGGVGTWVETTRHPSSKSGTSAMDRLPYYLSCATVNSSLEYAAYASELALALQKAGAKNKADLYRVSARKAWVYAMNPASRKMRTYRYQRKTIFYREPAEPAPELVVKAGLNLHRLWDDPQFLDAAEKAAKPALHSMKKNGWRWSPLFWIELEFFDGVSKPLEDLRKARSRSIITEANSMLKKQEENYPVRIAWYGPKEGWVHTMSWGTYHPLRRARALIAAHAMTGDRAYLDGACLANDFNNGANPNGFCMTSGLGRVYPVRYLSLDDYSNKKLMMEFAPGITPYRNTYGLPRAAIKMAYGLFYKARPQQKFDGLAVSLLPESGLNEKECAQKMNLMLPVWRRWGNVESQTVAASEFTVWETVAPAAAVTGYLLNGPQKPDPAWYSRKPVEDLRTLPGYNPLP